MIISVPFSDSGNEPKELYDILEEVELPKVYQFGLMAFLYGYKQVIYN